MKLLYFNDQQSAITGEMDRFLQQRRPPEEIRHMVDLLYRIDGQSIIVFEIRPKFQAPHEKTVIPVAKARYVKKSNRWKIFWMRSDGKWHTYTPQAEVLSLKNFTEIVNQDKHGCFWG